jgi:hypothetical protein
METLCLNSSFLLGAGYDNCSTAVCNASGLKQKTHSVALVLAGKQAQQNVFMVPQAFILIFEGGPSLVGLLKS